MAADRAGEPALSDAPRITPATIDGPAGAPLVAAMNRELFERYVGRPPRADELVSDDLDPAHLVPPDGVFLVALDGDAPVACGAFRRHDERTAEVKRMYVIPAARGRGISRAVLAELEQRARDAGYGRMVLETGIHQPEALALYASCGYARIENYGYWKDVAESRCFEKAL